MRYGPRTSCDACGAQNLARGTTMHGCRVCNFDACPECYAGADRTETESLLSGGMHDEDADWEVPRRGSGAEPCAEPCAGRSTVDGDSCRLTDGEAAVVGAECLLLEQGRTAEATHRGAPVDTSARSAMPSRMRPWALQRVQHKVMPVVKC